MFDALPPETVVVLPIGAIEQHGPHLPVWVDSCINELLLERALAAMPDAAPVLALPTSVRRQEQRTHRLRGHAQLFLRDADETMRFSSSASACAARGFAD